MQKFTREQIEGMKAKELMKLATSVGIKGAWDMRKADLIDAILSVAGWKEDDGNNVENKPASNKMKYIENVEIGTIVAFTTPSGKTESAKVINRSTSGRKLKVQTYFGKEYIVPFEDVIWVKTGSRWPRGVYNLLKGKGQEIKNA